MINKDRKVGCIRVAHVLFIVQISAAPATYVISGLHYTILHRVGESMIEKNFKWHVFDTFVQVSPPKYCPGWSLMGPSWF